MARKPFVAGYFYPGSAAELEATVARLTTAGLGGSSAVRIKARAVVVPHAGYQYSGPVAGAVFAGVEIPPTAVLLGPAHRSIRPLFALQSSGAWETPLGQTPVDGALAGAILKREKRVVDEPSAHDQEHSLEVQLPFLQYLRDDVAIVPITISHRADYPDLEALGTALAECIRKAEAPALLVASSDMSHYVEQAVAQKLDRLAIDAMVRMDPRGLYDVVMENDISMCGVRPAVAALTAARALGAERAELVGYRTSGESTGDYREVVGYAGIRVA